MTSEQAEPEPRRGALRLFDAVERIGNRMPDPLTLFVGFALLVLLASSLAARAGVSVRHPATGEVVAAVDLLSASGLRRVIGEAVKNFAAFPPLGTVLTTVIGVAVAERSGLFSAALRGLVRSVPRSWLTATIVFAGINAHVAADAGIIVLPPLAAALFASLRRHPLAGLAAAFAGVTGGFSASVVITSLDPLLSGLTDPAAKLVDPSYTVEPTANYYFMIVSTFLLTVIGTVVTHRWVEPRLGTWSAEEGDDPGAAQEDALAPLEPQQKRGLWAALVALVAVGALVFGLAVPDGALLRDADGSLRPFFDGLVLLVTIGFFVPGIAYGLFAGTIRSDKDVARMASETMGTMGGYIVLAFFTAQFVAYFGWSNLGLITAVKGAALLKDLGLTGAPLVIGFVFLSMTIDLLVASASAKWAVLSTVFVPMFMLLGYSPELAQAAYRIGDSIANPITPLLPYFPLLITFARKYVRNCGLGTLIASTMPYSIGFAIGWTLLLLLWMTLDLPLGPGAPIRYVAPAVLPG